VAYLKALPWHPLPGCIVEHNENALPEYFASQPRFEPDASGNTSIEFTAFNLYTPSSLSFAFCSIPVWRAQVQCPPGQLSRSVFMVFWRMFDDSWKSQSHRSQWRRACKRVVTRWKWNCVAIDSLIHTAYFFQNVYNHFVWALWRRATSIAPYRQSNPDSSVIQSVACSQYWQLSWVQS
jgi:hypothetical protein